MAENKSKSEVRQDYEILIRKRGESQYATYCPQLNLLLKGVEHEEVVAKMESEIEKHIASLTKNNDIAAQVDAAIESLENAND